ncbi:MAG: hypothetical protein WBG86_03820 [Polyangiales bacterium]
MTIVPEDIDLLDLTRLLRQRFGDSGPAGYVRGKTELRTAVVALLSCSEIEAELLVDTLEARGMIYYGGDKRSRIDDLESAWHWG